MKNKKWLALLTVIIMITALFSACSKSDTSNASGVDGGEQTTLKLSTWDYTSNENVSKAVEAFEKANPNTKIDVIDIPSADYNTKLSVMLNGGSELDVYFIKDASSTYDLYEKNQMLDLTDYVARDNIDMAAYSGTDKSFNIEDRQYAMPVRTDYYVLYYNKDLFDAADMDYPSNDMTWKEFEKTALEISGDDVYGAYLHTWQACVQNWGIQDGKNTIMSYETGYDFFKESYEMALRLQDAGAIQDFGELKSGNIHYSGAFAAGNVAMMPMGSWYMSTAIAAVQNNETKAVNWGVATLPHPENIDAGYTVGATTPLVINPSSTKQDAAWEFIKFMSGEEGANEYAKTGAIPARINDAIIAQVAALDGMPEGVADALKVKNIVPDRPIAPGVVEINVMLGEEHSMIMLGEVTIAEGLATMAERSKEILG